MGHVLEVLAGGIWTTVEITLLSLAIGATLGVPLVALRRSRHGVLRAPTIAIVEVLRAIPPIVWLFIIYYGVGSGAIRLSTLQAAVIGLGLISAAYLSEIYRAGLQALPAGQFEAARALSLPRAAALRRVILPQAIIVIIPPAATFAIGLLKDSAVASVIGATDITFLANQQTQADADGLRNFGLAAALYIVLSVPIAVVARGADRFLARRVLAA
jgi:polar amino acid transport system permease protein